MDLTTIELSGDKIPLMCNLGVLEELQDEFGTIQDFISKIAPLMTTGRLILRQFARTGCRMLMRWCMHYRV